MKAATPVQITLDAVGDTPGKRGLRAQQRVVAAAAVRGANSIDLPVIVICSDAKNGSQPLGERELDFSPRAERQFLDLVVTHDVVANPCRRAEKADFINVVETQVAAPAIVERAEPICRKRIEEVFGWIKAQAGLAKVKVRGCAKVEAVFTFADATCLSASKPRTNGEVLQMANNYEVSAKPSCGGATGCSPAKALQKPCCTKPRAGGSAMGLGRNVCHDGSYSTWLSLIGRLPAVHNCSVQRRA